MDVEEEEEEDADVEEGPFCMDIYTKNGDGHLRGHRFFACLRSRDAHGHFTRTIL